MTAQIKEASKNAIIKTIIQGLDGYVLAIRYSMQGWNEAQTNTSTIYWDTEENIEWDMQHYYLPTYYVGDNLKQLSKDNLLHLLDNVNNKCQLSTDTFGKYAGQLFVTNTD